MAHCHLKPCSGPRARCSTARVACLDVAICYQDVLFLQGASQAMKPKVDAVTYLRVQDLRTKRLKCPRGDSAGGCPLQYIPCHNGSGSNRTIVPYRNAR